jgi:hypothetical protein
VGVLLGDTEATGIVVVADDVIAATILSSARGIFHQLKQKVTSIVKQRRHLCIEI